MICRRQPDRVRGRTLVGYPALVDRGDVVAVSVFENQPSADRSHLLGLRRLVTLVSPDPTKWVFAHLGNEARLSLAAAPYPGLPEVLADARLRATGDLIRREVANPTGVRGEVAFRRLVDAVRVDAADQMMRTVSVAARISGGTNGCAACWTVR